MINKKLFAIIERHHKKILILWLIIALVCSPAAYYITKKSSSTELSFLPKTESWNALEILNEKFPEHGKSSFMITLSATNITRLEHLEDFVNELSNFCENKTRFPEMIKVYSVYVLLEQIATLYNESLVHVKNYLNTITPDLISEAYNNLYQVNSTLKSVIDMFKMVPYMYIETWWNISRFTFYTANQTQAFQRGALNETELNLLEKWLQMHNTTILQLFQALNQTGLLMYTSPYLGDNITSAISFNLLNTYLNAYYDPALFNGTTYTNSPVYSFLQLVNDSFTQLIENIYHKGNNTAIIDNYYVVDNPTASDFIIAFNNSQLPTLAGLLQLASSVTKIAGTMLLSLIESNNPSYYALMSAGFNLRDIDYNSDTLYTSTFLNLMVNYTLENFDAFIKGLNISEQFGYNLTASDLMTRQDLIMFLGMLYNQPYPLSNNVKNFLANVIVYQVITFVKERYPPPKSIDELDPHLYYSFVSKDNNTMLLIINLAAEPGNEKVAKYTEDIKAFIEYELNKYSLSLEYHITGDMALGYDILKVTNEDLGRIDIFTTLFVLTFLVVIFLSPIAPFIPLLVIGLAISFVYAILLGVLALGYDFPTLMLSLTTVVMMGAGVDYCVFMVYRYLQERNRAQTQREAAKSAFIHISETVLTSGLTVMVGFGSLLYTHITFINRLGFGPVIGIASSLLIALSSIPAAFLLFGDKLFWPRFEKKMKKLSVKSMSSLNKKLSKFVTKRPLLVILIFSLVTGPFIYYGLQVSVSYDLWDQLPSSADSVQGANILEQYFSIGELVPTELVLKWNAPINLTESGIPDLEYVTAINALITNISSVKGVDAIRTFTQPTAQPLSIERLMSPSYIDVIMIRQYISQDNTTIRMEIILSYSPYTNDAINTLKELKTVVSSVVNQNSLFKGAYVVLTGGTAVYQDLDTMLSKDTPIIIAICLTGVYVVLVLLLGSLVMPIILELTILISALTSLGVTELLFKNVFDLPVMWFLPVMLFVIIFGLGMDFNILLVTRIKEETQKRNSIKEAIMEGASQTGSIITASGLIMASAFSALLMAKMTSLKVMGFSIAFAIILDIIVVRFLAPAIMILLGKLNWWPNLRIKLSVNKKRSL